jgi:hypothetical protein
MNCRSGCKTKDHETYGQCLSAANIRTAATMNNPTASVVKNELSAYRSARANGIQPEGTTMNKVKEAESASRALGRPYNADVDPPANMIVNKNTARFVNAGA